MKTTHHLMIFFLLLQILFHYPSSSSAVRFEALNVATNYPGGARFEREIGIPYTLSIMKKIHNFIWTKIFEQNDKGQYAANRKIVEVAKVFIVEYDGAEAITYGENINVSSLYLKGYQGNLKWEYTSLLFHEITHVFQWNGEGKAPVGLVEGVADYTILKANYYPKAFAKPGQGDRWDQGYDFTARFLEYCDGLRPGFVAALNNMMQHDYSDSYFEKLTGKSLGQLWTDYKAKYSGGQQ